MPKRIPQHTVVVIRDGQRVKPEVGVAFDFTQDEVDSINGANSKALRHPINEGTDDVAETDDASASGKGDKKSTKKVTDKAEEL